MQLSTEVFCHLILEYVFRRQPAVPNLLHPGLLQSTVIQFAFTSIVKVFEPSDVQHYLAFWSGDSAKIFVSTGPCRIFGWARTINDYTGSLRGKIFTTKTIYWHGIFLKMKQSNEIGTDLRCRLEQRTITFVTPPPVAFYLTARWIGFGRLVTILSWKNEYFSSYFGV